MLLLFLAIRTTKTWPKERQLEVLYKMKTYGLASEAECEQAANEELVFSESAIKLESDAPYLLIWSERNWKEDTPQTSFSKVD